MDSTTTIDSSEILAMKIVIMSALSAQAIHFSGQERAWSFLDDLRKTALKAERESTMTSSFPFDERAFRERTARSINEIFDGINI
jgi:hypothetical protein